jgi:hypothetical protein
VADKSIGVGGAGGADGSASAGCGAGGGGAGDGVSMSFHSTFVREKMQQEGEILFGIGIMGLLIAVKSWTTEESYDGNRLIFVKSTFFVAAQQNCG